MLFLKHGVHVVEDNAVEPASTAKGAVTVAAAAVSAVSASAVANDETTPFDYLFETLTGDADAHLPATDAAATVAALKALGAAMTEQTPPAAANSSIPPVYTYWGQFIDHDMTANTDRDSAVSDITKPNLTPLDPAFVKAKLRNLRRPALDLDSVYGDGPDFLFGDTGDAALYDGMKFRIGSNATAAPGVRIPPDDDLSRDLPRVQQMLDGGFMQLSDFKPEQQAEPNFKTFAVIGDTRNDENLIISQFHLAVLRFHNRVVDQIVAGGNLARFGFGRHRRIGIFRLARRLTRWHYQWLVAHDYLKTVTRAGVADKILLGGPKHYKKRHGDTWMPLEFSVAAYRYGHSMVRAGYDHNRNFGAAVTGQAQPPLIPFASFDLLFEFTGNGHSRSGTSVVPSAFKGAPTLPFNWIIEWDRFTDKGSSVASHFARKIDTHLVPPLLDLINDANAVADPALKAMLKHLAQRNLIRGYLLHMPTGQAAAAAMDVEPLTEAELKQGASPEVIAALDQGGFATHTPLWFYVLKEAEVRCNGNTLGQLGSRIVCETIIGLLKADENSFLGQNNWDPADSPLRCEDGTPIVTIRDFLRFAGVAPQAGPADV